MNTIMVLDIGSSKVRCCLIDVSNGELSAQTIREVEWQHPQGGWVEVDPFVIWEASQAVVRTTIEIAKSDRAKICGISLSCMGDSLVPVDERYRPLYPMILAFDSRAAEEAKTIKDRVGDKRFMDITGGPNLPMLVCSKILWLKHHTPKVFEKTRYFLSAQQFIYAMLGLSISTDYTLACRKSTYDIRKKCWSEEIAASAGVDTVALGDKVCASSAIAGMISHFGEVELPEKTPIVYGCHDAECGYIGMGVDPNGGRILGNVCGTYDMIGSFHNKIPADINESDAEAGCGPEKDSYIISGSSLSGSYLEWFRKKLSAEKGPDAFDQLFKEICLDGNGSLYFIPDFEQAGDSFVGLNHQTGLNDMFKAVVEGVTFRLKHMVDEIENLYEKRFDLIRCGGGASQSDAWMQFKADLFDRQIERIHTHEASSVGAAILACVGLGIYPDYRSAIKHMVKVEGSFYPRRNFSAAYQRRYTEFMNIQITRAAKKR
jgi:xylulokinase